ncbi:vacuolar import and degradation protein-domain-containing protein [Trametes punicea]|nr:vacuolar import and degradation protein-domain-containing protein [Trametes punicea]
MPAEHPVPALHDAPQQDPAQAQIKLCLACRSPLAADSASAAPFILHDAEDSPVETTLVCASCRSRLAPPPREDLFAEVERQLLRRAASLQPAGNEAALNEPHHSAQSQPQSPSLVEPCPPQQLLMEASPAPSAAAAAAAASPRLFASSSGDALSCHPSLAHPSRFEKLPTSPATSPVLTRPTLAPIDTSHASSSQAPTAQRPTQASTTHASSSRQSANLAPSPPPDPLLDITRLRVRSQGHHCLYPGATFQGTQKSGRNSYDVNVTIVDVDFASSHLCGYLRIRGLTDDWPELTTYFDAEIIGSRYGFLTRNWGATEQEDMVHWGRFPAFRYVKNELNKPHLTMKDALNRGAVFMRWKEKFLVPDHRVQDINGASFAGFYYVCVDFNPQQTGSIHLPSPAEKAAELATSPTTNAQSAAMTKPDSAPRSRRVSVNRGTRRVGRSASRGCPSNVATMSGFYFHQNSEPYQQLSLVHVPEHTSSCFEFR